MEYLYFLLANWNLEKQIPLIKTNFVEVVPEETLFRNRIVWPYFLKHEFREITEIIFVIFFFYFNLSIFEFF